MRNKAMKIVLAAIMSATISVSALAAGSISAAMTVVETVTTVTDANGNEVEAVIKVTSAITEDSEIINNLPEELKATVLEINKTETAKEFQELVKGKVELADSTDTFDVEKMIPLTDMVDVIVELPDGTKMEDAKNVKAKIEVAKLKDLKDKEVRILFANPETGKLEVLKCTVDYENGTIEFTLPAAGPIMVVYND